MTCRFSTRRATSTVSSLDLSSTRITSSTHSRGISSTVRSSVRAAFQAGITTMTRPGGRSGTHGLHVDGAATAQRRLDERAGDSERGEHRGGRERERAAAGRERRAARAGAANRVVEIGPAGGRRHQSVQPAEHDLAAAQVAAPAHAQAQLLEAPQQRARWQVDEVTRKVEGEPALAEDPRLEAVRVGQRHHQHATRGEQLGRASEGVGGPRQVLERVPEDDRREVALLHVLDAGGADVGPGGNALEPDRLAAAPAQRVEQGAVARAHVEHRARRGDAVQPPRQRTSRSPQQRVAGAGEAAAGRPVPVPVGLAQGGCRGPRIGGRGATARAPDQATAALGAGRQAGGAPRAGRDRGVQLLCLRDRHGRRKAIGPPGPRNSLIAPMTVLNHALLGASVVALAAAGLRLASPLAERGLARVIAAATFPTAAAVAEGILLGLASLGGSTAALTVAALATGAAALAWLPRPAVPPGDELGAAWRARTPLERAGLGAIGGAALAWAAWQLRYPALGFDTLHYHLPEMVIFVQGGQPGSVHDVLPGLPVGNYPLTTEVTIGWAMGIARSFVPLVLWPWITLALTAASGWAGLRGLGATRLATGLAVSALCTSPWLLAWQSNGSVTDPPALAWLVACAALCAMSRDRPALMVPAIVAGGLAVGCKTTVLPFTVLVLALGLLWGGRERLRAMPARPLGLATALALLVGAVWYLRTLVTHGSPFWPIVAAPWGDPVPASVKLVHTSFLDRPRATVDLLGHSYLARFGGGLLLLACGAVLAPLLAPRRRVLAAAAVVGGALIWSRSPVTGIPLSDPLTETVFSTTRYALPVVPAGCLALALAASDRGRLRVLALAALAAAAVVNLVQTFRLEFPIAPSALTPATGALAGALL